LKINMAANTIAMSFKYFINFILKIKG